MTPSTTRSPRTAPRFGTTRGRGRFAGRSGTIVVALSLVLAACGGGGDADSDDEGSAPTVSPATLAPATTAPPESGPLTPVSISASTNSPPAQDSCGNSITYGPANVADGQGTTAWETPGDGTGQTIVFELAPGTTVTEVGLVPGYDKIDPCAGTDRFAQNFRVRTVRWTIGDGEPVEQTLDVADRRLQQIEVDPAEATRVTMEILATVAGSDADADTPISEITLSGYGGSGAASGGGAGGGSSSRPSTTTTTAPLPDLSPKDLAEAFVEALMYDQAPERYADQSVVDQVRSDPAFDFFRSLSGGSIGVDNPDGCFTGDVTEVCRVNVATEGPAMLVEVGMSTVLPDGSPTPGGTLRVVSATLIGS